MLMIMMVMVAMNDDLIMARPGWERKLMVDANQKWGRAQAIEWMKQVDGVMMIWLTMTTIDSAERVQASLDWGADKPRRCARSPSHCSGCSCSFNGNFIQSGNDDDKSVNNGQVYRNEGEVDNNAWQAVKEDGVGVATGECCQVVSNIFTMKCYDDADARTEWCSSSSWWLVPCSSVRYFPIQKGRYFFFVLQIDSARMSGLNEVWF